MIFIKIQSSSCEYNTQYQILRKETIQWPKQRLIDILVFNTNFFSISAILWHAKRNSENNDQQNTAQKTRLSNTNLLKTQV
jgi:hypothetical protein